MSSSLKITRWLRMGELETAHEDSEDALDEAGDILADCCDLGLPVFHAEDGRYYGFMTSVEMVELEPSHALHYAENSEDKDEDEDDDGHQS